MGHPAVESGVPIYVEIPRGTLNGAEITVQGRGMPRKGTNGFGNMCLKVNVSVQEAEARVLVEQSESIAAIFSYHREIPTGENIWITGATRG
jgi:DnaJ-class molecular chaperone